ncbi:hypothetical protein [Lysobacter capsici]|uniref:hypothetical protein n=1 Tax=Lysobacter capsici TaxID=435897 RepID=UPI001F2A1AB9|nr:hypothetical protein [Lysobacter capsici]UJB17549.1 hypothetical protein L1A79_14315 [Lysobacter capsici]
MVFKVNQIARHTPARADDLCLKFNETDRNQVLVIGVVERPVTADEVVKLPKCLNVRVIDVECGFQ